MMLACCGTVASPAEAAQATMAADCRLMDRRGADVTIPCKVVSHNDKVISLNVTLKNKENYSRVFTQIKKLPGDQWLVKDDTGREWPVWGVRPRKRNAGRRRGHLDRFRGPEQP